MSKVFQNILVVFFILINVACNESVDVSKLTSFEQAVYNQNRPDADREADAARQPAKLLAFSGLKSGMRVADISGGGGYYSEIFSHLVGAKGQVYLQNGPMFLSKEDNQDKVSERLIDNRLPNVVPINSKTATDLNLPENLDLIFLSKVYHDLYVPRENEMWNANIEEYFAQIHHSLNANGYLLVIDHAAVDGSGSSAAKQLHRIDEQFSRQDIESRGFVQVASSDLLRNPKDERILKIWNQKVRNKTDRFILLFKKK